MQALAASCEPVFAMTGKEALGYAHAIPGRFCAGTIQTACSQWNRFVKLFTNVNSSTNVCTFVSLFAS